MSALTFRGTVVYTSFQVSANEIGRGKVELTTEKKEVQVFQFIAAIGFNSHVNSLRPLARPPPESR